jgi:hypothetical protein
MRDHLWHRNRLGIERVANVHRGAGTFGVYAAICLTGTVFLYFRLPVSRGKTLEIEMSLSSGR